MPICNRPKPLPYPLYWYHPTIAEVRAARQRLWEEAGGTIEGLMDLVHRRTAHLPPDAHPPHENAPPPTDTD